MMLAVLAVSWIVAALATMQLHRIGALFTPGWRVRTLAVTALVLAVATSMSVLVGFAVALTDSHPPGIAVVAAALACWVLPGWYRAARHGFRVRASLRAGRVFRSSAHRSGDLLIVDDGTPDAFAVPGRRGVIVITVALADALTPRELTAVIGHERAHLRGRHHLFTQAVELAACVNPLLRPWCSVVRFAAERDADECAARPDRAAAASALARTAVLCSRSNASTGLPAGAFRVTGPGGDTVRRVRALQQPEPRKQCGWLLAAAGLVLVALCANVFLTADIAQDRVAPEPGEPANVLLG